MNNPYNIFLGIDLGGTKIEIIALNANGQSLYRTRTNTPTHPEPSRQYQLIIQEIHGLVQTCEAQLNIFKAPLGIGIPGSETQTGVIKNANTTCLIGRPFRNDLSQTLSRPISLENDANCFALSEATDGAGSSANSVFGVILGTGVGGGWVINQQLIIGPNHICGEWGHNPLPWPDEQDEPQQTCYCGKKGCIETYLCGPGMSRQAQLQSGIQLNSRQIIELRNKDDLAKISYERYVERLGKSLASVINIMDPQVIVLGGGLSNIDSLYLDVPNVWGKYVFSDEVKTKLVKNKFGDSSGVRGAAWLNKPRY